MSLSGLQANAKFFADPNGQCPEADLVGVYSAGLRAVLDRHAPLVTRCASRRRSAPWLTEEIRVAHRRRLQAERRWMLTHLTVNREICVKERAAVKTRIRKSRKLYYSNKTDVCSTTKQLFAVSHELVGKAKTTPLPSNTPHTQLPQRFCDFFVGKITQIPEDLGSGSHHPPFFSKCNVSQLSLFTPVTEELGPYV